MLKYEIHDIGIPGRINLGDLIAAVIHILVPTFGHTFA